MKVEISDNNNNQLRNISLHDQDELIPTKKISKYFPVIPAEENIHVIISPPESTRTDQARELLEQVAGLKKLFNKSVYKSIHARYQTSNDEAAFTFVYEDGNYSSQSDSEFRDMLWLFIKKNNFKLSVIMESPLSFYLWTFLKVCKLYGIRFHDPFLSDFPHFACECVKFSNERSQVIIKHLLTDLKYHFKVLPINRNETSRNKYVCAYLVAVTNIFENKFEVLPEKNVSGPNGHGPVDFGLTLLQNSRLASITEVKDKDFLQ
ncbi:hypothetical protein GLOIN_2v1881079 [Rhizophagus clarus]|uniref:Uncharacterized protein n=1 Tax=Rhizophagus clarus TaxID=94130 RepID=A0A8H3KSM9_9GLOM|nr:hypothetical protein GLOIN_2v1881079 [Rhizophagus clarus]